MLNECNLHKGVIDNLKKGSDISATKLITISEYFNVSADYLLGKTDFPNVPYSLTSEELKILNTFRKLNSDGKIKVQEYIGLLEPKYSNDFNIGNDIKNTLNSSIAKKQHTELK